MITVVLELTKFDGDDTSTVGPLHVSSEANEEFDKELANRLTLDDAKKEREEGEEEEEEDNTIILDYNNLTDIKSNYIRDIIETYGDGTDEVVISIPERYAVSLERYANWLQNRRIKNTSIASLDEDLQLAEYLDDTDYIDNLVRQLTQQRMYLKQLINKKLTSYSLEYLLMQLPYGLLPDVYKYDVDFRDRWMTGNRNRKLTIGGHTYHINVESVTETAWTPPNSAFRISLKSGIEGNSESGIRSDLETTPDSSEFGKRSPDSVDNWHSTLTNYSAGLAATFWDVKGYPVSALHYYVSGRLEGVVHRFDKLGNIRQLISYYHGSRHGLSLTFDQHNHLEKVEYYVHGKLQRHVDRVNLTKGFYLATALPKIGCSGLRETWVDYIATASLGPRFVPDDLYSNESLMHPELLLCGQRS